MCQCEKLVQDNHSQVKPKCSCQLCREEPIFSAPEWDTFATESQKEKDTNLVELWNTNLIPNTVPKRWKGRKQHLL